MIIQIKLNLTNLKKVYGYYFKFNKIKKETLNFFL